MGLFADIDDSYTRTGKGTLARWSSKLSMIPLVGGVFAFPLGAAATLIETAQWLFRGQFGSALTALLVGGASTAVNTFVGGGSSLGGITNASKWTWWAGNALSGATTDATLGTHARAATEALIGSVTGALGSKPQVLRSFTAGIGSVSAGMAQQGPGKFAAGVSAQRGQNADEAYNRYMAGEGGVHVNELKSAYGRGA